MDVQDCPGVIILVGKGALPLGRGHLHKLTLFPTLEKIALSQDWGGPSVHWCAQRPAILKEVVVLILHVPCKPSSNILI
eukprot:16076455-Heterocapsa_arctica.AAC.1